MCSLFFWGWRGCSPTVRSALVRPCSQKFDKHFHKITHPYLRRAISTENGFHGFTSRRPMNCPARWKRNKSNKRNKKNPFVKRTLHTSGRITTLNATHSQRGCTYFELSIYLCWTRYEKMAYISLAEGGLPVRKQQLANSWTNIYRTRCWSVILTGAYLLVLKTYTTVIFACCFIWV